MRNIFFNIIILILITLASCIDKPYTDLHNSTQPLQLREAGQSCIPDTASFNPGTCYPGQFIQNIQLNSYPGCNFFVRMHYIYCLGHGAVALHLGNFEILDHDCPQFNSDVLTAIANNTIDKFWFDFNVEVWRVMTNHYLNTFSPGEFGILKIEYLLSKCTKICTVESEIRPGGLTALIPVEIKCSNECCRRITHYESNNNEWHAIHQTVSTVGKSCDIPLNTCPLNTVHGTECEFQCDILIEF